MGSFFFGAARTFVRGVSELGVVLFSPARGRLVLQFGGAIFISGGGQGRVEFDHSPPVRALWVLVDITAVVVLHQVTCEKLPL